MNSIDFPNLGLHLNNVPDGFALFGVNIKLYGIVIALGFLAALAVVSKEAKRTGQDSEIYLDYLLWGIIPSIVCARLYYVIFSWDYYFQEGDTLLQSLLRVINIRQGGLAIYGGLIGGILTAIIFAHAKKLSVFTMLDTIAIGIPLAQAMGRMGNFFNREAFGTYTDSLLAMAIPVEYYQKNGTFYALVSEGIITDEMLQNTVDGAIWVHPTFLYEAVWNLLLFGLLLFLTKRKRFKGEMLSIYVFGYGLGRFFIEALRTDPLMIGNTNLRVSQVLALVLVVASAAFYIYRSIQYSRYGKYVIEVGNSSTTSSTGEGEGNGDSEDETASKE